MRTSSLLFLMISSSRAAPTPFPTHTFSPSAPTQTPTPYPTSNVRQDIAVSTLYFATNGASWSTNTNWMTGDPCNNTWYGLICNTYDDSGRLVINQLLLASNSLSGTIPTELGLLTSITRNLNLQSNQLSGSLPSQVGTLTLCTAGIYVDGNDLSGFLPSEIGQFSGLKSALSLFSNQFSGTIPTQFGYLTSMNFNIYLQSNSLSGTIPSELATAVKMRIAYRFDSNRLSGSIPSEFGLLAAMTNSLYFSSNSLSGSVPSQLGLLVDMVDEGIRLDSNSFCGDLPVNVSNLDPYILTTSGIGTPCCEHSFPSSAPLANMSFTCAPSPVPTQPSSPPTPLPTVIPFSQPSQVPTPSPSTLSPTSTDTHFVEFSFKLSVTSQFGEDYAPGVSDQSALLSVTESFLSNDVLRFKVYIPTPTSLPSAAPTISSRPIPTPSLIPTPVPDLSRLRGRKLTSSGLATWTVSFELASLQNEDVLIQNTTTILSSATYATSVGTALNATDITVADVVSIIDTRNPTMAPSMSPTTWVPSQVPTITPTPVPTKFPIAPTSLPTLKPSPVPTPLPTLTPSFAPTAIPTSQPTTFTENSLAFAGATVAGFILLSFLICYPLLKDSPKPLDKTLGAPRQRSVLDADCLEFLGIIFDEEILPSIITRFELSRVPGIVSPSTPNSETVSSPTTEVDSLTLLMRQIKEQEEAGEVDKASLPHWAFGDLLALSDAFLTDEPLDLNQNEVNAFMKKVKKYKGSLKASATKAPKGMTKAAIEMIDSVPLTKEELEEQQRIKIESQKQASLEAELAAESRDDAYGFISSRLKLKGARGRAISSKLKQMGYDSKVDFAAFDQDIMSDSALKTDFGLVNVEVRKFREACLKEKELVDSNTAPHDAETPNPLARSRSSSPRQDRIASNRSPRKERAGSPRKNTSPRKETPLSTTRVKPGQSGDTASQSLPEKGKGKGKGKVRNTNSSVPSLENRGVPTSPVVAESRGATGTLL